MAVTVIAFVGSVFSPYYARARRRGHADPENHVAINVALYAPGGGWAMTERGRAALRRDRASFQVGPSALTDDGSTLTIAIDEVTVPLPRRLRGTIRVALPRREERAFALDGMGLHVWRPIAPTARMSVTFDRPALAFEGDAYVDHNRGDEPLEAAFRRWSWARTSTGGRTFVTYAVEPRHAAARGFALAFGTEGLEAVGPAPPAVRMRRGLWGMERPVPSEDSGATVLERTLEDAPFYTRSVVRATVAGVTARGVHESLSLDLFSRPIVQAMLPFRMPRRA